MEARLLNKLETCFINQGGGFISFFSRNFLGWIYVFAAFIIGEILHKFDRISLKK